MAGTRKKHRASSLSKRKGEGEKKIKKGKREGEREREQGSSKKSSNEGSEHYSLRRPRIVPVLWQVSQTACHSGLQRLDWTRN